MSLKLVIVILVVITGVFIALLVVGGTQHGKGSAGGEKNGVVDWIESVAGGAATIDPNQVDAACATQDPTLLQFTGSCVLTVHNGSKSVKVLQLSTPVQVVITAPAPKGDNTVTAKSKTDEVNKVAV